MSDNKQSTVLAIKDLEVCVDDKDGCKTIIQGLNLEIKANEVVAIMGPNGSGKTTLASVLARHPNYNIEAGSIEYLGQNINELSPEECAQRGMFLSFQYPVAIPGVSNVQFIKTAVNACRQAQGKDPYDSVDFLQIIKAKMASLNIDQDFLYRPINEGFSGGEKKRNEILQMLLLEPKLAILDETDSGLDIDALKDVANGINQQRNKDCGILLITHYQRLLDYIEPDRVHVLSGGKIIHSGDKSLPKNIEQHGYAWVKQQTGAS